MYVVALDEKQGIMARHADFCTLCMSAQSYQRSGDEKIKDVTVSSASGEIDN